MPRRLHRPHGFPGQHMVVLPDPVRSSARAHPLLKGLHVTDAGYFPNARGHQVRRPQGATTTLVLLCMGGKGWVTSQERTSELRRGDFFWLPPNQPHAYGADPKDPWSVVWAHFAGLEVAAWRDLLQSAAQAPGAIALSPDRLDEVALDQAHAALERGYALRHQVLAAAGLRRALSTVAELAAKRQELRSAGERVVAAAEKLRREWQRPHRLQELATTAGMSVTHFSALFRRHTGFAPIDYLIRQRVQHACRLLDTTQLPVSEVAERVGYTDAYYFTRSFRRVMGVAPRIYRLVPKG